jgi:outer membrane protein W
MKAQVSHVSPIAVFLAVGTAAVVPFGVQAQEESGEYDWKLFVGGAYVTPLSDNDVGGATIEASSEFGYELGVEWKPSDRFGFEVAYLDATHDVEVDGFKAGEIDFKPWNFTMNFHIIDRNAFNWYIGPTVTYVDWGDVEAVGGGSESIDSETSYGVSTGLAIGLGQSLALQFGLRYLDASAESSVDGSEFDVDPLFANVSLAFRF